MKFNVKVDVPNLMHDLKQTPKVCGYYSIHFSCCPLDLPNEIFVALANQL